MKNNNSQKKTFPYDFQIDLETRATGNVVARVAALPGCQAQGNNVKQALENLKNAIDLYFSTASPAYFETLENFDSVPIFYSLAEFKGRLFAATGRDKVFVSNSGAAGSWKAHLVTKTDTKFFTPDAGNSEAGDYSTQVYCLTAYSTPGKEKVLFAGTNLNGSIYYTNDGETWKESFATGEDRIHALCEFKNRLYAGTSSQGKIYSYDGLHWNAVGNLSETAVTSMGVFKNKLYVGTYPSGLIFCTDDGLNWEEVASTGQSFIQCLKEFDGALYAGTSGPKGVKIYRTTNGRDWLVVYDSGRELNCYCMEVFENTLFAGTGNSGRVLKSRDGVEWTTAYAGDVEGVRAFAVFNDYLFAGSENQAALLRSTYDMARNPAISELKIDRVTSQSVVLSWVTDIAATSEVHYGEKDNEVEMNQMFQDKSQTLKHKVFLTGLKADTEYEVKVLSAHRSSSLAVTETLSIKTPAVVPPSMTSTTHPQQDKWEKFDHVEIVLNPLAHLRGYYYCLDQKSDTVPMPPEATYTDSNRIILQGIPQGQWYVHVSGVDEAGNVGIEAAHYRVNIDTEALPPAKVYSSTHPDSDKWVPNPTPVIAWEAPEDLSGIVGYYVKADKVPDTVPGPSKGDLTKENRITLGPLEDDLWYVHISTLDTVGNVGAQAAHYPIRIDTKAQAPAVSSETHPESGQWYSNHKLEVTLVPAQDLSGVDGFYYSLNQDANTLPTPEEARWTKKTKINFDRLNDGVWYFHVRTKDRAENLSPQATHFKVCVDTEAMAPVVTSNTHPDEKKWHRDRTVILNWESPEDYSGVDGFYYSIDRKVDTVPNESSLLTTQKTLTFELTEDGLWYFHISTKDKAGNLSRQAGHYAIRVDTKVSKPSIYSTTHPDENEWYSKIKAVFKLTPPEDMSGVAGYYYTFSDDPRVQPAAQGSSYTEKNEITLEIPRDGVHYLSVLCLDKAGNVSEEPTIYKVRLDTHVEAPELTSTSHPDSTFWYCNRHVEINWKEPADLSGIEGYYTIINHEENWMPVLKEMNWTTSKTAVFNLPDDGIWYAHICAKDKAQNIGALAHFKIMTDSNALAPVVKSLTHPVHRWVKSAAPKLTWEVPQDMAGIEGYYVVIDTHPHTIPGPSNGEWVNRTFMTAPALKDGKWYFHIAAKDKAGNVSKEATHYPIWVDMTAPKSTMVRLPALMDKTQLNINWDATDASGEVVSFDVQVRTGVDGLWGDWLVGVTNKTATYQGQDGIHYGFRCRATDAAGNVEAYTDIEMVGVTIDISPPTPVINLKATPILAGDIELKWNPAEDRVSGLNFYRVYRWLEGEKPKLISTDGEVKEVTYIDKGGRLQENTVYYYSVHPVDKLGNEQFEGNTTAASLSDSGVGTPSLSSPTHSSDDWSSNPLAVMTWTAPADATGVVGYYYSIDLSPSTKLTSEKGTFINKTRLELPKQESGVWYFHLIAKDRAGNTSDQTAHYRLKIDVQKPEAPHVISHSHSDKERWYSEPKVQYQLTFAPKLSGLDCYYYLFDQKPDTIPMPDFAMKAIEMPIEVKADESGVWYFHVVSRDKAGNLSKPTHSSVLISLGEMPPPVIASSTHPREGEAVNNQAPVFTWEDRHDGSFVPKGYFYKLSPNEKETLTEKDSFTTERMVNLKDVEQGTWYFHVAAVSKKGKPGQLYSTRQIVIDRLGKVFGHFLRKDGKTPVAGTKVEMAQGEKITAACVTDVEGKFNFPTLHEGKYEIRLHSDQFPVLRIKDINVTVDEGMIDTTFVEDLGMLPNPPLPGPVRFYYFLKEDCNVTFEIFDSTGVLVVKLEEKKEGGAYAVTIWDATKMPVGEYLYKLSAKSVLKNTMSRFSVKKFKLEKPVGELEPQAVS